MISITHKETGTVLFEVDADTLEEAILRKLDLRGADLSGLNLDAAILSGADLRDANLIGSELNGADLTFADMRGADLSDASLQGAFLYNTFLQNANLTNANLMHVQFSKADFSGTDFTCAIFGSTMFSNCENLHEAVGLDTINHVETSSVDVNTLKQNIQQIPTEFLRDTGFTSEQIQELRTQYGPYHSCFISYARLDHEFVELFYADLRAAHVSCWRDEVNLRAGTDWREGIEKALLTSDKVLLVCSENSLKSENVQQEIITTIEFERLHKVRKLILLCLDDYITTQQFDELRKQKNASGEWGVDWVSTVKSNQMLDFRRWTERDHYKALLQILLRDLKQSD